MLLKEIQIILRCIRWSVLEKCRCPVDTLYDSTGSALH